MFSVYYTWFLYILMDDNYCQTFNISGIKFQNFIVSDLILQLSLPNPLKPGWEWRCSWTGAAPTTSEWSTILFPKVQLILEVWE